MKNTEQRLYPEGAAILTDANEKQKVFFIHSFTDVATLQHDVFLYQLLEQKGLHLKRFHLVSGAAIRVIVLVPSYKAILQVKKYLRNEFYEQVLFLPVNRVHQGNIIYLDVFISHNGNVSPLAANNSGGAG